MCQMRVIILVACCVQAHAIEPVAQNIMNMKNSTGAMIDDLADMLLDRALKVWFLRGADLDDSNFAQVQPRTRPTLHTRPLLPAHGASSPVSRSLFPVATSFVPVFHLNNALRIPRSLTISEAFPRGFVKEGNRKDKVASKKKREIMSKVMARDSDEQIADELVGMEQLLHDRINQQEQTTHRRIPGYGRWIR